MANEALEKAPSNVLAARPEHIKKGMRGQEKITNNDIVIPRLSLCQSTSKQRKKTSGEKYIPGLEEGMLFNSFSGKIYGTSVDVIPLFFYKSRIYFKDIEQGGGILCQAPDGVSCQLNHGGPCLHAGWGPSGERPECDEFYNYFSLIQPTNELIVISLKSTGIKAGKAWNMLIRQREADMFAGVYNIFTSPDQNSANQDYFRFNVQNAEPAEKAWATPQLLAYAENEYNHVLEAFNQGKIAVQNPEDDGNDAIGKRDTEM